MPWSDPVYDIPGVTDNSVCIWHISLGRNEEAQLKFCQNKICIQGPSPKNVNFLLHFLLMVLKSKRCLLSKYIHVESVKIYEMTTRKSTQNKFNNKHRSARKILCNIFQGTILLNITYRKILHRGNVTLWDFRWNIFYFNKCHI